MTLPRRVRQSLICLPVAIAAASFTSCSADDGPTEITEIRTVTREKVSIRPGASIAERFGMTPVGAARTTPAATQSPLAWDTPAGWLAKPSTETRLANFGLEGSDEVECYLSVLPGTGGGVAGNINRWRSQMSQPPLSETEIASLPTISMLGMGAVKAVIDGTYVGMSGGENKADYRMYGAVLLVGENSLFVKMTGPKAVLEAQEANFDAFCTSIRIERDTAAPEPADAPAPEAESITTAWTAPASWELEPARQMREVSYRIGPEKKTECYVSVLSGAAGGVLANVNRWYSQMGQSPITEADLAALPKIKLYGQDVPLVEVSGTFTGMSGGPQAGYKMLGTLVERSGNMVFVKMVGPESDVNAEKTNFVSFCESMQ